MKVIAVIPARYDSTRFAGKVLARDTGKYLIQHTYERACMHAKCIVVDNQELLITSANFTQAAQARNIEAGLVLRDEVTARRVVAQFDRLVELGRMLALPVS